MKIKVNLSSKSVMQAKNKVDNVNKKLKLYSEKVLERLAELGATRAIIAYNEVDYDGIKDFNVEVVRIDSNHYKIIASGTSILFLEFGSGITFGYGHPQADENDMGPGTYPTEKGHWNQPYGWWFENPQGEGYIHTRGNKPGMGIYYAQEIIKNEAEKVFKEVFK